MADVLTETVKAAVREAPIETSPVEEHIITTAVVAKVANDPIAQNALSQEPWYQSRVANYGAAIGLVSGFKVAGAVYANRFNLPAYNAMDMSFDLMILWGSLGVLYGRFVGGLRPMWYRLFGGTK